MSWVVTSWVRVFVSAALLSCLALASCGQTDAGGSDSNTHWLKTCESDDDCGSLDCLCGVCSRSCEETSDCRGLGSSAVCEASADCSDDAPSLCVAGGSGNGAPEPCAPLDARSAGTLCAGVAGYTWNGTICEPVMCTCAGDDCGSLFQTAEQCDRAYQACYADAGLTRSCETHADCRLRPRTCCTPCATIQEADQMIAENLSADGASVCLGDPGGNCTDCDSIQNPALYPACIDGQCTVMNLTNFAGCAVDEQCRVSTKDCCECGGDVSATGLIAVNPTFSRHPECAAVACGECAADFAGATAVCNQEVGFCEVVPASAP